MIVAIVDNIMVALNYCPHASIVAENSNFVKETYAVRHTPLQPKTRNATHIPPALEGAGFYAAG
jgi:hypothetical protein